MKKQLKLFSLLTIIVFGVFAVTSWLFLPASATYVEGNIDQDTVWTLTDSPFVVINNVVIKPGFTLTLEPGVEVRFGGNFSLIVQGTLNAVGTQERMITFTSNKLQPQTGDWATIRFINRTQPSMIAYSVVKYGTRGITVENGNVEVKNSVISDNLENGILITGNNGASIHENTVQFNKDGIFIEGDSSGATIQQNIISANSRTGINLQSIVGKSINNIQVLSNTLSGNFKGIDVYGQVSVEVTRNSISYNDIGVYYGNATGILPVQFNDIYSNTCGMNVSASEPVNAEYNYWGDETGPAHPSLCPEGKGNPVQSDGDNVDFIPFLSAPNGYINTRPVARLLSEKLLVPPNQTITFLATTSSDDRRVDEYFFDFGDGKNSSWTTLSIFEHQYRSAGTYQASVIVIDDFGVISNNNAIVSITVQTLTPLDVSLILSRPNIVSTGQVSITAQATLAGSPVQNANITLFSIPAGSFATTSGLTDSTGHFATTFTAPSVTEQTDLRITARASKTGNADGSDHEYLSVVPPLSVEVALNPNSIKSDATSNGTVHVVYGANPVEGVTVRMSSDGGGTFTLQNGPSDADGYFKFTFKAPQTLTQLDITLTATATKIGYWDGSAQSKISVVPRTLVVEVTTDPTAIESELTTNVIVKVTSDEEPVANATVAVSSDSGGTFSNTTGTTNADGKLVVSFTAPKATTETGITITASANKAGHVNGQDQATVTVHSAPSSEASSVFGLPLTTLLLIIIPVIVAVIVVILIKKRVIVFSRAEEV